MGRFLRVGLGVAISCAVMAVGVTSSVYADDGGGARIRIRDDCNPKTFNAVLGAGTCVGDGDTTFQAFLGEFLATGDVDRWRFDPSSVSVPRGGRLEVENEGGETHTFTKVAAFGGGFVPLLNTRPNGAPPLQTVPECGTPTAPNLSAALAAEDSSAPFPNEVHLTGGSSKLPVGTNLFQCCIHPWMHAVVTVRP
jgi:hypothetical protein